MTDTDTSDLQADFGPVDVCCCGPNCTGIQSVRFQCPVKTDFAQAPFTVCPCDAECGHVFEEVTLDFLEDEAQPFQTMMRHLSAAKKLDMTTHRAHAHIAAAKHAAMTCLFLASLGSLREKPQYLPGFAEMLDGNILDTKDIVEERAQL